jgi:hypothetical protein
MESGPMIKFTMHYIRSLPGIRRDFDSLEDGLVDFEYEAFEHVDPVPLKSVDREGAKLEAFQIWHQWCLAPANSEVEGYWIGTLSDGWRLSLKISRLR